MSPNDEWIRDRLSDLNWVDQGPHAVALYKLAFRHGYQIGLTQ